MSPVYKLSNAGGFTSKQRYTSMLAGNTAYSPFSFESIATVSVGSGGSSSAEFTSIPGTYTHLQIRCFARSTLTTDTNSICFQVGNNSFDTSSNYAWHQLGGDGSTTFGNGGATQTNMLMPQSTSDFISNANIFGVAVVDILDYANTNKYKTLRGIGGWDANGSGLSLLRSGLWQSTSAINQIKIFNPSTNWKQYSHFALYGIKAA